jgi:tyrosine-protein kinase Etk/Wzc
MVTRGSAPPNPAELLMHPRFTEFLTTIAHDYDYVLIDTPPALAVADAAIIGSLASVSFLVLKTGAHPMREIAEAAKRLQRAGVNVKGTVFNQTVAAAGYYGYSRYAYSYQTYETKK